MSDVLRSHVLPCAQQFGNVFVLQDDNVRFHRGAISGCLSLTKSYHTIRLVCVWPSSQWTVLSQFGNSWTELFSEASTSTPSSYSWKSPRLSLEPSWSILDQPPDQLSAAQMFGIYSFKLWMMDAPIIKHLTVWNILLSDSFERAS